MTDFSIRRMTVAEEARVAARQFLERGEPEPNPYTGTPREQEWRSAYECSLLDLSTERCGDNA